MQIKLKSISERCSQCPKRPISAFKDLSDSQCRSIDSIRELKTVKSEDTLFFMNKNSPVFYCIQSGHLKLGLENVQKSGVLRICGPGDLVGYEPCSPHRTAQMLEDGNVCSIDKIEFLKIQSSEPEIATSVIQALVKIIKIKDERIIGLENHTVRNRVASTLFSLVKKFGLQSKNGYLINTKIDRKTLSQLAGTVTESLARVLTDLENEKIVSRQGRKLLVLCKDKLREASKS